MTISVKKFSELLLLGNLEEVIENHVFAGPLYAIPQPRAEADLRAHLESEMATRFSDLFVVGSARLGFSLHPDRFPSPIRPLSDVDVVVIHPDLFDEIWFAALSWSYPYRMNAGGPDRRWADARMRDTFFGWFSPSLIKYEGVSLPDRLKPLQAISSRWFGAFRGASRLPNFASRTVNGRLYRTREHAMQYHLDGLNQIKTRLAGRN